MVLALMDAYAFVKFFSFWLLVDDIYTVPPTPPPQNP